MHLKYLVLPLALGLIASSVQAEDACSPPAPPAAGAAIARPVYISHTYTSYNRNLPGSSGSATAALATVAVVGVVGYLVLKHEHDKAEAAKAAACAAAKPVDTSYILPPPADPNAPMTIDGIVYTPTAKKDAAAPQAPAAQTSAVAVNP